MGNIYTKLNQLMMNDVDSAADPERPREKLETEFNTPAHHVRLPDPRSASQYIDRTPVFASLAKMGGSGDTPTTHKSAVFRARYLETDLDDVLKSNPSTNMMTSTPVPRKVIASPPVVEEIIDSIIEQAMEQISQLNFSDNGACEVVTSERSDSFLYLRRSLSEANKANISATSNGCGNFSTDVIADGSVPSYAEEVVIHPEDVFELSDVVDENAGDSLMDNWTGIGGPERSVGTEGELSCNVPDCSTSDIFIIVDDYSHGPPSDSLIVHNHSSYETSSMMVQSDPASICTNSDSAFDLPESNVDDSILVNSPALVYRDDNDANKNVLSTPQKSLLTHKTAPRTPLGDISRNSPVIGQLQTKPAMLNDGKIWKNVQDERMKKGLISENISPLPSAFSSYPPEVVQSAPGKLRARNVKKPGTKWANDSLII